MSTLEEGETFKANQPLAFTKNFNKNGMYCSGKNISIAVLNYFGLNHEDSYIITKELADETKTDTVEAISIEIPPNTTIINLETEKTNMLMPAIYLLNFLMRIV